MRKSSTQKMRVEKFNIVKTVSGRPQKAHPGQYSASLRKSRARESRREMTS